MASDLTLPANVHVSKHPCLQVKLSQLRSSSQDARGVKTLVHEIATIVLCEALALSLSTEASGQGKSTLGHMYDLQTLLPARISLVPILRSGLSMVDAATALLPFPIPIHHLGLFREPVSLQPVEYYNNLPYHQDPPPTPGGTLVPRPDHLAIVVDPIIATGGTAVATIQTLREWGVSRVLFVSVLGSAEGVKRAAEEWREGVQIWVGGVDRECDARGMLMPGVGDIGDRLFCTKGR